MKNNNQAALDLFSNSSDFTLTDDELLAIHGGTTQGGSASSHSGSAGSAGAPMGPPPPSLPQIVPLTVHVEIKADATHAGEAVVDAAHEVVHEAVDIVHDVHHSETVGAIDHFVGTAINAATNYLFGHTAGTGY